ncbi:hypothetical protein VTK56DRAFT_5667 [Thermocarpiscus australiensis]
MSSHHSSKYGSNVVVVQSSSRPSTCSASPSPSRSTTYSTYYPQSTSTMSSSTASQSTAQGSFRSGSSTTFYTQVKETPRAVVVQHNRPNPFDKNEPKSSDYPYSHRSYNSNSRS